MQGLKSGSFTNTTTTEISTSKSFQGKDKAKIKDNNLLMKSVTAYPKRKLSFYQESFHLTLK